jgi:CsoR family transcriptional regulator, copper-sensing transcriptional repressor
MLKSLSTHPPGGWVERDFFMTNDNVLRRLKTVEGHIRGIERMLEEDAYCIDIIRQVQAVQAALNKINGIILEDHLNSCLITAVRGDDPNERERVLKEIADVFDMAAKT